MNTTLQTMKKNETTNKAQVRIPVEPPIELPQAQSMPFHEFVRRIIRVTPQDSKLPKR
jgi:hypothetical protein